MSMALSHLRNPHSLRMLSIPDPYPQISRILQIPPVGFRLRTCRRASPFRASAACNLLLYNRLRATSAQSPESADTVHSRPSEAQL
jgi:hypothetical protein